MAGLAEAVAWMRLGCPQDDASIQGCAGVNYGQVLSQPLSHDIQAHAVQCSCFPGSATNMNWAAAQGIYSLL